MLEACALTKIYQGAPALDSLNLTIPSGEIFGYVPFNCGKYSNLLTFSS